MPEPLLKIQNLSFSYGEQKILHNLSLTLQAGEIVTLIGRSGSGKSTLFKILTGILPLDRSSISFEGSLEKSIAYMTQEDLLLPWRTVWENLLLISELGKQPIPSFSLEQEAKVLLSQLSLENCSDKYPYQLSGGMRQRVSLARTLLLKRPLLLLDEPFGSLDVVLREQIYCLLRQIRDQLNCSILLVTHDFHDAICFSDRILLMHEGSIHKTWCINDERKNSPSSIAITDQIRQELCCLQWPNR